MMLSGKTLVYCAILEVAYLGASFAISQYYGQWSALGEVIRTTLRLIPILGYGYILVNCNFSAFSFYQSKQQKLSPVFWFAVMLFLGLAVAYTNAKGETIAWQLLFAGSGLMAGLREELLYRGLLQQHFSTRFGAKVGLVIASSLFTLSHVQYLYHAQWQGLTLIALAGIIFGSIFIYTKSIVLTALIHGIYDALLSLDFSTPRLNGSTALIVLTVITLLFLQLVYKDLRSEKTNESDNSNQDRLGMG